MLTFGIQHLLILGVQSTDFLLLQNKIKQIEYPNPIEEFQSDFLD